MNSANFGKIHNFLSQKVEEDKVNELIADACEEYAIDVPLAWSIRLDSQSDLDRFGFAPSNDEAKNLKWGPYPYDYWFFQESDKRFGDDWPGRIPAQVAAQVLYFYTRQGDLVMDPMAGGGVVPDVCLALNRKCRAFDVVVGNSEMRVHKRPEIEHWGWNIEAMEWPDVKPNLIFFDPPYFDKKDKEYDEGSISALSREDYLRFFETWFKLAFGNVKKGGVLAFLMSDWDDETGERDGIFIWDYADLIKDAGWRLVRHIQVPLPTQQVHGDIVTKFRKSRRLARLERYLLIAEA